jgi:leucyl/phenylalanyl-tRNA--protein transferase
MHLLTEKIWFPAVTEASSEGLLAVGGDLSVDRLKLAYQSGIFPWYGDAQPIMWWSPDPRMVLFPDELYVSKNLRKKINKEHFRISFNTNFEQVIRYCAGVEREDQGGTWITDAMLEAYLEFHKIGWAQSVEVWNKEKLVGGLYGVNLQSKKIFCGESMFSLESDASKVALYYLAETLKNRNYRLIDCQMYTEHLERLGAREIPRDDFIQYLTQV